MVDLGTLAAALRRQVADLLKRKTTRPLPTLDGVEPLEESVVGSAAAGGMQPAPMDATKPGGQAAAELAADIGHRRPDERAGLLKAEVVDLEPADFAVLPAADHRQGDLVRIHAELSPAVLGPGAQLLGKIGHKHQLCGFAFRVASE
jgi:hypothetical protein